MSLENEKHLGFYAENRANGPDDYADDYVIETRDLTKQFRNKNAVDAVSIHVKRGAVYGLIGRNGAGKTTLMRMLLSLARPTGGEMFLFGQKAEPALLRRVGSLIEEPAIYKNCTAQENLKRFCILYNVDPGCIPGLLETVGLQDVGNKKAGKFSLGMKQRLGIAIAMLGDPELMILDEPVNGLDPTGMKEVRDVILRLNREKGVTFLISSHLLDELSRMVTDYGILNNGKLAEEISARELELRCRRKLVFTVDDAERARQILTENLPGAEILQESSRLILLSHLDEAAKMNRLLVQGGIGVTGIRDDAAGIEDYFMERMGRENE